MKQVYVTLCFNVTVCTTAVLAATHAGLFHKACHVSNIQTRIQRVLNDLYLVSSASESWRLFPAPTQTCNELYIVQEDARPLSLLRIYVQF